MSNVQTSVDIVALARKQRQHLGSDTLCRAFDVPSKARRKERPNIGDEQRVAKFGVEILLESYARYLVPTVLHISQEGIDDALRVGLSALERHGQIEKITPLMWLRIRTRAG